MKIQRQNMCSIEEENNACEGPLTSSALFSYESRDCDQKENVLNAEKTHIRMSILVT